MFKTIYPCLIALVFVFNPIFTQVCPAGDMVEREPEIKSNPAAAASSEISINSLPTAVTGSVENGLAAPPAQQPSPNGDSIEAGLPSSTAQDSLETGVQINPAEIKSDIKKLLAGNKKIFFLEQMAALKMSDDNGVESLLNSLYDERESLCIKLAGACRGGDAQNAVKIIKGHILNTKLYELYGLDSLTSYALNYPGSNAQQGETAAAEIAADKINDSLLELASYIKLENTRLANSNFFLDDLNKYMAAPDFDTQSGTVSSGGGASDGGFSKEESKVLFVPEELSPGANSTEAPINSPIAIKFNAGRLNSPAYKTALNVNSVMLSRKYSRASRGAGSISFKWDAAASSLIITPSANLERNMHYNACISFDHKIAAPPAKQPSHQLSPQKGFFRSRSVNGGLFKTVDINLSDKTVSYKLEWNFQTIAYQSTSSEALLSSSDSSATNENEIIDNSTAEVELKDRRDTDEAEIGDKSDNKIKNGTAESALNKKGMMTGELFEQPKNMPMIINRAPEGVSIMSGSEIFIVFSCDIDPASINNNTMQLFGETAKSEFEKLGYKLKLNGRRLTLIPQNPLSASKNYKVLVTSVRTAKKLSMPINETFYFKTGCAVLSAKLAHDGKVKKDETFEITLSEDLADLNINFFEIENKKEKPIEFDKCGKVFPQPSKPAKPSLSSITLGAARTLNAAQAAAGHNANNKTADASKKIIVKEDGPVTIFIKPRSPLVKGRDYKIDVFSRYGVIENGIIKFSAK
jgi:hypothetical protein